MDNQNLYFELNTENEFEKSSISNGGKYWYASVLMQMLGYKDKGAFQKALNKAIGICTLLDIQIEQHFIKCIREDTKEQDRKLSRYACYLTAMNADIKKPEVAAAQVYLAGLASCIKDYYQTIESMRRVELRQEISEDEKSLSSTIKEAGIEKYDYFRNAGYLGMYNMTLSQIKIRKDIPEGRLLFDFISSEELAANQFRITQTEAKIKKEGIKGQKELEKAAKSVGKMVRDNMVNKPEDLPICEDIKKVRKGLKETKKELVKIDKQKKKKIRKEETE